MLYTTTINRNGMILLNKDARKALGVKLGDKVTVDFGGKTVQVARMMTEEEAQKYMDSLFSPETKQLIKEYAGKSDDELLDMAFAKAFKEEMEEGRI